MACVGALRTFGAPAPLTLGVRPLIAKQRLMRITVASALLLFTALSSYAGTDISDLVNKSATCHDGECTFNIGQELQFTLVGIGQPNAAVVFERVSSEGDYYASVGALHGCVIVHNGPKTKPILTQRAFVSLVTGKAYGTWRECKSARKAA